MEFSFHYPESYHNGAIAFNETYQLVSIISCPSEPMELTTLSADRQCRFCGKKDPHVSFHKRAHIIPEMLGNKYLINDFECDSCNHVFSKQEGDLANFLGVFRTLNGTIGKNDVPNFESVGDGVYAKKTSFFNQTEAITIARKNQKSPYFSISPDKNEIQVTYKKAGYVPVNVYKVFLKIGLSVVPKEEMSNFRNAIGYLLAQNKDKAYLDPALLRMYAMPLGFGPDAPVIMFFKKKRAETQSPTYYFILSYKNYSFNFPIPLYKPDMAWHNEMTYLFCPPLFMQPYKENPVKFLRSTLNLASYEKKKGEIEHLNIQLNEDPAGRIAIDSKTLQPVENAVQDQISQLYFLVDPNFSIPIK